MTAPASPRKRLRWLGPVLVLAAVVLATLDVVWLADFLEDRPLGVEPHDLDVKDDRELVLTGGEAVRLYSGSDHASPRLEARFTGARLEIDSLTESRLTGESEDDGVIRFDSLSGQLVDPEAEACHSQAVLAPSAGEEGDARWIVRSARGEDGEPRLTLRPVAGALHFDFTVHIPGAPDTSRSPYCRVLLRDRDRWGYVPVPVQLAVDVAEGGAAELIFHDLPEGDDPPELVPDLGSFTAAELRERASGEPFQEARGDGPSSVRVAALTREERGLTVEVTGNGWLRTYQKEPEDDWTRLDYVQAWLARPPAGRLAVHRPPGCPGPVAHPGEGVAAGAAPLVGPAAPRTEASPAGGDSARIGAVPRHPRRSLPVLALSLALTAAHLLPAPGRADRRRLLLTDRDAAEARVELVLERRARAARLGVHLRRRPVHAHQPGAPAGRGAPRGLASGC